MSLKNYCFVILYYYPIINKTVHETRVFFPENREYIFTKRGVKKIHFIPNLCSVQKRKAFLL